ncbi:MAG: hypothetical protein QM676_09880 [Novosphingobium sp.]
MSKAGHAIAAARIERDAARETFDARLAAIRADLDARSIGSRMAGTVVGEASDAIEVGLDVAREHKGLIAGTIGALLLWIFRQPLFGAAVALYGRLSGDSAEEIEDEDRDQSD